MTDSVKRAEELLAGITPGDWSIEAEEDSSYLFVVNEFGAVVAKLHGEKDAEFFAAAPSLVRELIARNKEREAEVKALREERDELRAKQCCPCRFCGMACESSKTPNSEITTLREVVEKVRKHCNARIKELSPPVYSPMNLVACALRTVLSLLPEVPK